MSKSSKVSVAVRQTIVPFIKAFAKDQGIPFNKVSGAVLFAAERTKGRIYQKTALALISLDTVAAYDLELARRVTARETQVAGMIKNALPKAYRTPANIASVRELVGDFYDHAPINVLKTVITLHAEDVVKEAK